MFGGGTHIHTHIPKDRLHVLVAKCAFNLYSFDFMTRTKHHAASYTDMSDSLFDGECLFKINVK